MQENPATPVAPVGDVQELNVAHALSAMYRTMAADPSMAHLAHPSAHPEVVAGLQRFYRMLEEDLHQYTPRSWGLHVSDMSREPGWGCDRYLWFGLLGEEKTNMETDDLLRTSEVGHAMHFQLFHRIGPALLWHYRGRLEILAYYIEAEVAGDVVQSEPPLPPPPTGAEMVAIPGLISGHIDLVIDGILDGRPFRVVIDVKSTSSRKTVQRQKRGARSTSRRVLDVEPHYYRQVSGYVTLSAADYGILLFWDKQHPHNFTQQSVSHRPAIASRILNRGVLLEDALETMDVLPPATRTFCEACPFAAPCGRADSRVLDTIWEKGEESC